MKNSTEITYVAMDVHKKQHSIAMILPGSDQVTEWTIHNNDREIKRMVKRLEKAAPGQIEVCYEAGVCGFALQRKLSNKRIDCKVIAPSLIPYKPGDRVKTDRRDAKKLVEYFMAGQLTEVHPPTPEQEAVRSLCRLRDSTQADLKRVRHQLLKYLTVYGFIYNERANWTQKHLLWMKGVKFEEPLAQLVFDEYIMEFEHRLAHVKSLDKEIEKVSKQDPYKVAVGALRCFYGIDTTTAMGIVCEMFAFERFDEADRFMSYLGLTPSENSSGGKERKGPITKAGNSRVRLLLIEAAWHYRSRPSVSGALKKRRKGQEPWMIEIADKCHKRLYRRYRHLIEKGKTPNVAITAVARELAGFVWSVLHTLIELVPESEVK
jgi:transposase